MPLLSSGMVQPRTEASGDARLGIRPELVAICTVDLSVRRANFIAMLRALPTDVRLVTVVRGTQEPDAEVLSCMPPNNSILRVPHASLSVARNLALDEVGSWGVSASTVICFPDDDCTWAPSTAEAIRSAFSDEAVSLIIGRYRPADAPFNERTYPDTPTLLTPRLVLRRCASIATFTRAHTALDLRFDERLGVGAMYPSAEDTDFALRVLARGGVARYDPTIVCLHRYELEPDPARKVVAGFVIGRHLKRFPSLLLTAVTWWSRRMLRGPKRVQGTRLLARGFLNIPRRA